jgi:hypothetical protein
VEPDGGGKAFRDKLAATSAVKDRLHLVDLGEHKDASGLHCADPDTFEDHLNSALRNATPHAQFARAEAEVASRQPWSACKDPVLVPNLLDRFATDLAALGVAGESRLGKVVYLAVTSRLLPKPVSVAVKGPSSGGKSYTVEQVLGSFDRTLAALVREGTVLKGEDGYLLAGDGYRLAGDGSASEPERTRPGSGIFVYCVRCEGSHPRPDKGSGETSEEVHRQAIAP